MTIALNQSRQFAGSQSRSGRFRNRLMAGGATGLCLAAIVAHAPLAAQPAFAEETPFAASTGGRGFQGTPNVVSGGAVVVQNPGLDVVTVTTPQAVINWTPDDRTGTGTINFLPVGSTGRFVGSSDFTVLNRILPLDGNDMPITRMIALNGTIESQIINPLTGATSRGGNVWFYNAGGILVGSSGVINVGSLVLSARDIDTTGGLFGSNGEIRFRDPATAGASASRIEIAPGAVVSASRAGGASAYVALVAPRIVQAGSVFADGSVGLIAAEQADVRINNGLFDITVTVGTSDANGIVHTGTTGGVLDASGAHVAYLVAVPKNQAMTMLLSGDIGFVAGQNATMNADGNIVISAGHNVGGTVIGPAANQNTTASAIIGDVIFRNSVIGQASDTFALRSILSCAPFCSSFSPQGQILFNRGATLSARRAINVSVGQAQQIVANGNLSLLAADAATGQGGSIFVSMNNGAPLSPSTSGGGVMLVTGDLLLDASARGNATMTGDATGGSTTVEVVNGMLSANRLIALANGTAGLGMSQDAAGNGPTGQGGSVTVLAGQGGLISASDLFARADGGAQTGFGPDGSDGIGGEVLLGARDGGTLSVTNQLVASAIGTGTIGTARSGMGMGGTVDLSVVDAASSVIAGSTNLDASGYGGGTEGQSNTSSTPETMIGGTGAGGIVRLINAGTANLGSFTANADGFGGSASSLTSTDTPLGGAGTGGTIDINILGGVTTFDNMALLASATGGGGGGTGGTTGVAIGGDISVTASNGGRLQVDGTSLVETNATAASHSGGAVGAVTGGTIVIRADTDGSIVLGGRAEFDATADARRRQFNTAASTAGAATGGRINVEADGGFISFSGVDAHADGVASHGTMLGGAATGGSISLRAINGGVLNHSSSFDIYTADGDAGSGQTGGNGRGGEIALIADAGSLNFGQFTAFQARGEGGQSFDGIHLAMGQGGDISVNVTGDEDSRLTFGTVNLDTSGTTSIGGEGFVNVGDGADARGGNIDINLGGTVTGSSLSASAVGGGLGRGDGRGGRISLSILGGDTNIFDVSLNADGESSNFLTSDVGGDGFGGSIDIFFTSGSYTGSTISASAQGRGGNGLSAFSQAPIGGGEGGQNFFEVFGGFGGPYVTGQYNAPSNGGDGFGGFINIRANGNADVSLTGGLFGDASGIGGEGGNAVADPFTDPATPGNGGRGFGGTINFDFDSGTLSSGPSSTGGAFISLSANGIGGEGGSLFVDPFGDFVCGNFGCGEGFGNGEGDVVALPTDDGHPDGGLGVGGHVTITLRGQTDAVFAADTSGNGGRGGRSLTGGNGGEGRGGVSTLVALNTDVGSPNFSLISEGFGGSGGNGINGDGGDGGFGEGGTARAVAVGIDAILRAGNGLFGTTGRGGHGGDAFVSEFTAEIPERGGNGGNGGQGNGGTIEFETVDGSIILGAEGVAGFASNGFGGNGGDGADNGFGPSDVATFGGHGGSGGTAGGGLVRLRAQSGGTISVDSGGALSVNATGFAGEGGLGGVGTVVPILDMMGMPIGSNGGGGFSGGNGFTLGGTISLQAFDSDDSRGLIALGNTSLFADGDVAGRIELIDGSSGAAGITFNSLYASAFGGAITSSDFSIIGSGIYISSGRGAITVANDATLETDGEIRFDISNDGGFTAAGPLSLRADRITGIHGVDPGFDGMVATFSGGTVSASARIIDLRTGSVGRAHGSMILNASEMLGFDQLVSDNGPMQLFSGGGILGTTAKSGGFFSSNSGGGTNIRTVLAQTDADIVALGFIDIGSLTTTTGFAELDGNGVTIGTGAIATTLNINSTGTVSLTDVTSGGTANIFAGGLATIGMLESTSGGILIQHSSALDAESLIAGNNINVSGVGSIDIASAMAGGALSLASEQNIHLGSATGASIGMNADGQIDFGTINVGGSASIGAEGNITGMSLDAGDVFAFSFGGGIDIDDIFAFGNVRLTAENGLVAGGTAESRFGAIVIDANNVDYGTLLAGGLIEVNAGDAITIANATTRDNAGQDSGGDQGSFTAVTPTFNIILTAGGVVTLGTLDALDSINITGASLAGATSSLTAGNDINVLTTGNAVFGDMFATSGLVDIDAGGNVTGSNIEAGDVDVASSSGDIDIDDIFATGQIVLTALDGLVTGGTAESQFSTILIDADTVDYGTLLAGGLIDVHAANALTVANATTRNNAGQGSAGSGGEQGAFATSTGAFDIVLTAGGVVTLGTLNALDSIHINGASLAGTTSSLTAGDNINILTTGNAVFGGMFATSGLVDIDAGGNVTGSNIVASTDAAIVAAGSINIGALTTATGLATLTGNGVTIGTGAIATTLNINSTGLVDLTNVVSGGTTTISAGALATIGTLESTNGDIIINPANGVDAGSLVADGGINIVGDGDIDIDSAMAGGLIDLFTDQDIRLGTANGNSLEMEAEGSIDFGTINVAGSANIGAEGNITGMSLDAGGVFAVSFGGGIDIDDIFAFGNVRLTANNGLVAGGTAESMLGSVLINAQNVDYGTLLAGGLIDVHAANAITVASATTRNNAGQGGAGNGGEQGAFSTSTGAFDIVLTAGGVVTLGTVDALDSIHINGASLAGATSTLRSGDDITINTTGNAVFGTALAGIGLIDVQAGGSITGTSATTNGGNASFVGTTGVNLGTVRVPGTLLLRATGGNVLVSDLRSGLVTALGLAVDLTTTATNVIDNVEATAGAVTLRGTAGNLTVNSGRATGAFNATTNVGALSVGTLTGGSIALDAATTAALTGNVTSTNLLAVTSRQATSVNAVATGGSVRITSGDIVIGASGRVGTGGTTTLVELINGDATARTFIGGADQADEYSLSAAELQRLFGGNITIRAPRVNAQSGTALGSTRPPDVVIGAFTFTGGGAASGAQLGTSGTLSIITPGSARVVGAAALSNMNSTNGFAIAAEQAIEVIMGQGSIRLTGSGPNGLGGTLTLTSEDVVVATMQAITDIAALTDVAAIDARLAMNDGVTSDDGALSAGAITFDVLDGVYVQNSGLSDEFDDRRGFTANSLNIFTESSSSRIVINGRVGNDMGVLHTGIDAIALAFINDVAGGTLGGYDSLSTINGCVIADPASCSAPDIETSFPVQDVVQEEVDEEDGNETPYRNLITLREAPDNPQEPVLEDPITGSGNEDLWVPDEEE